MDHSMSPDEQEQEQGKCVRGYSLGHHKAKSWDADHLAADHEKEHHSDSEHFDKREQRKRLDVLVARNRRKRTNADTEDPDPFHASTQRKWESKHKRQDHRRHLRRSIWHPTGRIAGPSAAEEAGNVVDAQARVDGVVERLFHYDSSDEERLETTREYRMMKRRRQAMQELLDLKKLRDLSEREERSTAAVVPEPKRFKGWKDRMVHAEKVLHSKHEPDHGYYRELYYALRADQPGSQERRAIYGEPGLDAEEEVDAESSFLWPPVLLVNNAAAHKVEDEREATGTLTEVRAVFSGKHNKQNVVVYPATEVGFVDALSLSKKLEACHEDPEKLIRVDHRRYRTLVDPHEDDGLSSSDDSAYSRREAELPGNRSKKCHETNVRLIKRTGGDGKNLHWRLKNPQEWVDVDPVKGLCEKWSNTFRLSQDPPPVEVHPWKLTEKVFHFLSMSPSGSQPVSVEDPVNSIDQSM